MKCKVLLVGEGPSDIGDLADQPSYREGREGFLQPLLRKMVGEKVELEFDGRKLVHLPKDPSGRGHLRKLQAGNAGRALALASQSRANVLVLACDADKTPGKRAERMELKRRLHLLRKSVEDGFEQLRGDDEDAAAIQTVIAIPGRMIEAWALGDRKALTRLLDRPASNLEYGEPEALWGDEQDPESDHPKCVWQRVTRRRVNFADIGGAADPSALVEACPDSFPPFAEDVARALNECPVTGGARPRRPEAVMTRRKGRPAKVVRRGLGAGGYLKKRKPPRTVRGRAGETATGRGASARGVAQ